jgi:citrate synthase
LGKNHPVPEYGIDYITRHEAIERLGIKPETLYSYVSRGWIRRLRHPDKKQSLYFKEDVEKIRARSDARKKEGVVAAGAMQYGGEPVILTAITEITRGGPRYRNYSAVELARSGVPFESSAALLWSGPSVVESVSSAARKSIVWPLEPVPAGFLQLANSIGELHENKGIHELFSIMTLALGIGIGNPGERTKQGSEFIPEARQLIQTLSGCLGFLSSRHAYRPIAPGESIAEAVIRSLGGSPVPASLHAMNAALTLSADHELNPATFAARIAASSEADLHSCIAAAICTHSGARIARACDRLEDFFSSAKTKTQLVNKIIALEKTFQAIPGFNHPMYPKGDPRAYCLLDIIRETLPQAKQLEKIYDFLDEAAARLQLYPRIELAIVALAFALELPSRSAAGLYTFGRTAGWVSHVMEQRITGQLIRPRAKFVGATN